MNGMAKSTYLISDRLCGQCDPSRAGFQDQPENRYSCGSFAPEHENVNAKFLVDGKETFAEMAKAIESAKTDVRC